jgi:carboxymethylenebutenolidase
VQEYWGLNDQIKSICDRFAAEGFLALAPDLYHGTVIGYGNKEEAGHKLANFDWGRGMADIAGAIAYLREHGNGKVAITGFCMGGALSLAAAANIPGLSAVIPFYGVPGAQDYSKVTAPIQAHFSKTDGWAKPSIAEEIKATVEKAGGTMEVYVYDAEHAFMNASRPDVYSKADADLAWKRAIEFLKKHS